MGGGVADQPGGEKDAGEASRLQLRVDLQHCVCQWGELWRGGGEEGGGETLSSCSEL